MPTRTCPNVGSRLEATVVRYLSDVELDDAGAIIGYETATGPVNDPGGYVWDHPIVRVYCENDHEVDWDLPYCVEWYQRNSSPADGTPTGA